MGEYDGASCWRETCEVILFLADVLDLTVVVLDLVDDADVDGLTVSHCSLMSWDNIGGEREMSASMRETAWDPRPRRHKDKPTSTLIFIASSVRFSSVS